MWTWQKNYNVRSSNAKSTLYEKTWFKNLLKIGNGL